MQLPANNASPDKLTRDREWLVIAGRHWSASPSRANEFATHGVGRRLLEDIPNPQRAAETPGATRSRLTLRGLRHR